MRENYLWRRYVPVAVLCLAGFLLAGLMAFISSTQVAARSAPPPTAQVRATPPPRAVPTPTAAPLPAGKMFYVSPGGQDAGSGSLRSPWRTLAHALDAVPDQGAVIIAAAGVYNECVVVKRRFRSRLTVRAATPYRVVWSCDQPTHILKVGGGRNITFQGFEFRRPKQGNLPNFVAVWRAGDKWAESITFRDNIFHDTHDSDLLHLGGGARDLLVEGNVFYNQAGRDGQHIDVNSAVDVVIRDNIFFNDGVRPDTNSFIVVKDSEGREDGILGARNVTIRGNVFLNWKGGERAFVMVGEDGVAYYEAIGVTIADNLMLATSPARLFAPIAVRGSRDVTVRDNTVAGALPCRYSGVAAYRVKDNRANANLDISGNTWRGVPLPDEVPLPRWDGRRFGGGYATIREAFTALYGRMP